MSEIQQMLSNLPLQPFPEDEDIKLELWRTGERETGGLLLFRRQAPTDTWLVEEVISWLQVADIYPASFLCAIRQHNITGSRLLSLSSSDLVQLGLLDSSHISTLLSSISALSSSSSSTSISISTTSISTTSI